MKILNGPILPAAIISAVILILLMFSIILASSFGSPDKSKAEESAREWAASRGIEPQRILCVKAKEFIACDVEGTAMTVNLVCDNDACVSR